MDNLNKKIWVTATFLGATTIAIGAFGAHGLKKLVDAEALNTFETGVRYQMYHILALLILGFINAITETTKKWVFRFFIVGILLFSGSIYALSLNNVIPFNTQFLGPITPIGGILLIMGWIRWGIGICKLKS